MKAEYEKKGKKWKETIEMWRSRVGEQRAGYEQMLEEMENTIEDLELRLRENRGRTGVENGRLKQEISQLEEEKRVLGLRNSKLKERVAELEHELRNDKWGRTIREMEKKKKDSDDRIERITKRNSLLTDLLSEQAIEISGYKQGKTAPEAVTATPKPGKERSASRAKDGAAGNVGNDMSKALKMMYTMLMDELSNSKDPAAAKAKTRKLIDIAASGRLREFLKE